jgi:hypothetical protein
MDMISNGTYSPRVTPRWRPLPSGKTAQQVRDNPKMAQTAILMDLGLATPRARK